jgi:(E)-4-hydroxy-3-methylbut-2-enyl-diphosphate synthase
MEKEGMAFPLHLGVTEAGDGEDGRIKSAVGIGTLLMEGIGDTIRVSLSEDPEAEIPVARKLVNYVVGKSNTPRSNYEANQIWFRRFNNSHFVRNDENSFSETPIVISDYSQATSCEIHPDLTPDFLYLGANIDLKYTENQKVIVCFSSFSSRKNEFPLFTVQEKAAWLSCDSPLQFLSLDESHLDAGFLEALKQKPQTVILLSGSFSEQKTFICRLVEAGVKNPVVIRRIYEEQDLESFQIKSSVDCGVFFLDRLADGIFLQNAGSALNPVEINACSFGILQATGRRISKTEYISCPSCGRTLFDLQATLKKVKAATAHLKGLKIGVMGCIVNGPGEMADADFGYVGAGVGKVSLYKGKTCVKKNIPESEAVEELLRLIADSCAKRE